MSGVEDKAKTRKELLVDSCSLDAFLTEKWIRLEDCNKEIEKRENHIHGLNIQREFRKKKTEELEQRLEKEIGYAKNRENIIRALLGKEVKKP